MDHSMKVKCFEYVLSILLDWHRKECPERPNDIGYLKSLKLLFFLSAIGTERSSDHTLLDTTFEKFVAMPFGHVESEIYNAIIKKELKYFNLNVKNCMQNGELPEWSEVIDSEIKQKIDSSFELLKKWPRLIKADPFELVEISHLWYSWKHYFTQGRMRGNNSEPIPIQIIKMEEKIFSLD